jgi:hypothetical protein
VREIERNKKCDTDNCRGGWDIWQKSMAPVLGR